jgi:(2R)-ethylmalonyl-CoA mutase
VVASKVAELTSAARAEIDAIIAMGGVRAAVESGYMKSALVRSMTARVTRINTGAQVVVGVNRWTEALPSPLIGGEDGGVFRVDPVEVKETLAALGRTRTRREVGAVERALADLRRAAESGENMMEASIRCALARVTTGEWADALREVFGEYRALTGVEGQSLGLDGERVAELRRRVAVFAERCGHRPRLVVAKPGLDGHSNGAEVIAVAARHSGFEVIYSGIRVSPQEIVQTAVEENADLIGVSLLSGSHLELAAAILDLLGEQGAAGEIPMVVGGIIPPADAAALTARGVSGVFTPADYELIDVMERILDVIEARAARAA